MFCPQCGSPQNDELKFCKLCGVNLDALRQAAAIPDGRGTFDWSRTWVAEMFLSHSERKRRIEEIQRERGITPEMKRFTEIKAGVITSSIGVALMIVLYSLMQGVVLSGHQPPGDAEILARVWIAGVIPFLVGMALIINGCFVSKKQIESARQIGQRVSQHDQGAPELGPADTAQFIPSNFGVTEGTTHHLQTPSQKQTN